MHARNLHALFKGNGVGIRHDDSPLVHRAWRAVALLLSPLWRARRALGPAPPACAVQTAFSDWHSWPRYMALRCIRTSKFTMRGVELRTVDAGKLALVAEQHAASAAHAGAVDHDGVEADHGLDAQRPGHLCDGTHHGHGADGENKIELAAGGDQFVELFRDQALFAVAAIVGHDAGFVARGAHLVFKDHHLFAARAFNEDDVIAGILQRHCRGQRHGRSHASGHDHGGSVVPDLGRAAERADDIENRVACLKRIQQRRGFAHGLDCDGDGSRRRIGALDGERNALAMIVKPQDHELAWPLLARDARRLDGKLPDIEAGGTGFHDPEHGWSRCSSRSLVRFFSRAGGLRQCALHAVQSPWDTGARGRGSLHAPRSALIIQKLLALACDASHAPERA